MIHRAGDRWPRRDVLRVLGAGTVGVPWLRVAPADQPLQGGTSTFRATPILPMAVWYGGGKARAPMPESGAREKKEAWRADVRRIADLGFNTLRAWIDWASGEPEEGRYQFETLEILLELAEQHRLRLLLQVYMDSAPAWIGEKYPDALFVSSNGQAIVPESSPGYCRDHPGVRDLDVAFYAALAARARQSPAFLGWDLWSEPHVINWANPTWIPNPEFCFCAHTLVRFRQWLQHKYSTIDALNAAWYRRFRAWDHVQPSRMSTILSYTDYIDWKAFIVDKLGADLRDRYDSVKRVAPDTIITSHAAGVGLFASPHHWEGQADDWTMARQVDYYGTSFYPKHSALVDRDVPWRAALLDFTRSFGYDQDRRGFWVGELQGGFGTIGVNVSPTVSTRDLTIWTWSALARGAKGISYYAWYPMNSGYEAGGFGLNHLDGTITDRARAAGAIARVVDRHQSLLLEARPPRAEVAIVYNPLAHFVGGRQRAATYGGPQGEVIGIERDSLLGIHRALFPHNVPIDYVHVDHLDAARLVQYRVVFFPYPLMIRQAVGPVLRAYVESGGTLVTEARLGWSNERGYASDRIPGMGLWEVVGAREVAVETVQGKSARMQWTADDIPGTTPGSTLAGRWYKETLEPATPSARVVARWEDGTGAAIAASLGRGRTLMLGSYVSAAYQAGPTPETARLFRGIVEWVGIQLPIEVTGAALEVRHLDRGKDVVLFAFNHEAASASSIIRLRRRDGHARITDLVTGADVTARRDADALAIPVTIPSGEVRVLHVSPA